MAQEIRKRFYSGDYSDCDKDRCPLFHDNNKIFDALSAEDPLYRLDIEKCLVEQDVIIENGPRSLSDLSVL